MRWTYWGSRGAYGGGGGLDGPSVVESWLLPRHSWKAASADVREPVNKGHHRQGAKMAHILLRR